MGRDLFPIVSSVHEAMTDTEYLFNKYLLNERDIAIHVVFYFNTCLYLYDTHIFKCICVYMYDMQKSVHYHILC